MGKATHTIIVTDSSNGVSVDYEAEASMTLLVPEMAAEVIKDLMNTACPYDTENEHDVCGWQLLLIADGAIPASPQKKPP